jgi:hypothetical protein
MRLTMAKRSKVLRASRSIRVTVTTAGDQLAEHPVKLAPVGTRARRLLPVDASVAASGLAELLKLAVEGLPVGADADIADKPVFRDL